MAGLSRWQKSPPRDRGLASAANDSNDSIAARLSSVAAAAPVAAEAPKEEAKQDVEEEEEVSEEEAAAGLSALFG